MVEAWEMMRKKTDREWARIKTSDRKAKEAKVLVGRYITHPYADGQAVYRIVREGKATVKIEVCTGIGDDWVLPAWGRESSISKRIALEFIGRRDWMEETFKKR